MTEDNFSEKDEHSDEKTTGLWYYTRVVGGGLLLALVANAIWDSVGKYVFWEGIDYGVQLLSYVSSPFINHPYSKAPLDPVHITLLFFMMFLFFSGLFVLITRTVSDSRKEYSIILVLIAAFGLWMCGSSIFYGIAVDIHREFQSDLQAMAPYLSDEEEEDLVAEYNRVRTRDEMMRIRYKMQRIASEAGVELRN